MPSVSLKRIMYRDAVMVRVGVCMTQTFKEAQDTIPVKNGVNALGVFSFFFGFNFDHECSTLESFKVGMCHCW